MKCSWMYTGSDGRSHFADLEIPDSFVGPPEPGFVPAMGVQFRDWKSRFHKPEFHYSHHGRALVMMMMGIAEYECGDGTKRRIGPGEVLLLDDTTGEGHIVHEISDMRRLAIVALPADLDIAKWQVKR